MNLTRINLAPKRAGWRRFAVADLVLAALALATAWLLSQQLLRLYSAERQLTEQLAASRRSTAEARPMVNRTAAPALTEAAALQINTAIRQMNLPWSDLLDSIEEATPADIAVLVIEPDAQKNVLRGTAEASRPDRMLEYVRLLKKQSAFSQVVLTKHEVRDKDPNRPVRFEFAAYWMQADEAAATSSKTATSGTQPVQKPVF